MSGLQFNIDLAIPTEFYMDPTLSRAIGVACPRCKQPNKVVFTAWVGEQDIRSCFGCRACRFRWWANTAGS